MERIPLDQPTLKALAGETRIRMLKLLDVRSRTQSEIAYELHLSLPTVTEHMDALLAADLVEREETTRKWKYYNLTQKARLLLHPNTTTIWFVLGLFLFSIAATMFSAVKYLAPVQVSGVPAMMAEAKMAADQAMAEAAPAVVLAPQTPSWALIIFGTATIIFLIVLLLTLRRSGWLGKSRSNKKNI